MSTNNPAAATKTLRDNDDVEGDLPPSPFTTTSDVMNALNRVMQQYHTVHTDDNDSESQRQQQQQKSQPAFELQRKLPDGSSRKASPGELKAADLETKLKQVAQHVATLPNEQAKLEFCRQQRLYGNQLYQKAEYEQAIDVYLTCLMAIPTTTTTTTTTTSRGQSLVFLQVMNNLAQSAIQLQWYRKAQDFCRLALQEVCDSTDGDAIDDMETVPVERQVQIAKLYYKRAKASRYKGEYTAARKDLTQALSVLDKMEENNDTIASRKAIRKEWQAVQAASAEGRKNEQRHRMAMQQVLGGGATRNVLTQELSHKSTRTETTSTTNTTMSTPLYEMPRGRQRQYSTLRAPDTSIHDKYNNNDDDYDEFDVLANLPMGLRYWHYYLRVVGRVAETLLQWIGDDDEARSGDAGPVKANKVD